MTSAILLAWRRSSSRRAAALPALAADRGGRPRATRRRRLHARQWRTPSPARRSPCDTIWVHDRRLPGLLHEPRLRPRRSPASAGRRTPCNILFKNFVVFAVSSHRVPARRVRAHVRRRQPDHRLERAVLRVGRRQQPRDGGRLQRRVPRPQLDRACRSGPSSSSSSSSPAPPRRSCPARWPSGSSSSRSSSSRSSWWGSSTRSAAHWIWGGGWLATKGFLDFAGSTVVHSVGGWAAPGGHHRPRPAHGEVRPGRQGQRHPRPQHDLGGHRRAASSGSAGSGSTPAPRWRRTAPSIAHVATTTNVAAAAATVSSHDRGLAAPREARLRHDPRTAASRGSSRSPRRAPSSASPASLVIGVIAGVLVVLAVLFFDRHPDRRPGGRHRRPPGQRRVRHLALGLFADPPVCPAAAAAKKGLFMGGGMAQLGPQLMASG